jgi:hypothetical protein
MKIMIALATLLIFSTGAFAQTLEDRIRILEETLKKQEQTIRELRNLQEALKKQEETINEQRKLIEELKVEVKQPQPPAPTPAAAPDQAGSTRQVQQQVKELDEKVKEVVEAQKKNILSIFNPAIGFVGESIFSYNTKGSNETGSGRPGGFDVFQRTMELDLAASVDPFARGYVVINGSADPVTGESNLTVEEAAIQTTSLPWNLTLKAGQFFGEYGRLSYIHDHELPFVNRPLVLDQYVGGESKTIGAQLNYLLPIPHYVSLTAGVGTQFGDVPNNVGDFRHFDELNFWSRASTYFDLTPDISLETGVSALFNPKTEGLGDPILQPNGSMFTERKRLLLGTDIALRYQPLRNNQFRSLTWGTELLYSDNRYLVNPTGNPSEVQFNRSVNSFGMYSYLDYKFDRQWRAGFLFESLEQPQNNHARTFAYSPYITWALSHWNQLRLQYTHTANNVETGLKDNDAIYLQWAWIIGSHAHGWQER